MAGTASLTRETLIAPPELYVEGDDEIMLQQLVPADASVMHELEKANAEFFDRYDMGSGAKDLGQVRKVLEERQTEVDDGVRAPYKIIYLGTYVGEVALHTRETPASSTAKMGYHVAKDVQRKGIAIRAAARLCTFGFEEWGLRRIRLDIRPWNDASKRLAMRLGAYRFDLKGSKVPTYPVCYADRLNYERWRIDKEGFNV